MATRTRTVFIDDLDDSEILDGGGQTVTFAVGTSAYEIDLSDENLGKFYDALQPFTEKARRVRGRSARRSSAASESLGHPTTATDKEQLRAMRLWAQEKGCKVSNRGRVSKEVQDAYHAAH